MAGGKRFERVRNQVFGATVGLVSVDSQGFHGNHQHAGDFEPSERDGAFHHGHPRRVRGVFPRVEKRFRFREAENQRRVWQHVERA